MHQSDEENHQKMRIKKKTAENNDDLSDNEACNDTNANQNKKHQRKPSKKNLKKKSAKNDNELSENEYMMKGCGIIFYLIYPNYNKRMLKH